MLISLIDMKQTIFLPGIMLKLLMFLQLNNTVTVRCTAPLSTIAQALKGGFGQQKRTKFKQFVLLFQILLQLLNGQWTSEMKNIVYALSSLHSVSWGINHFDAETCFETKFPDPLNEGFKF